MVRVWRHAARQRADGFGRDAGDRGRPLGVLYLAIGRAGQIGQHALEADAVARQECLVVELLGNQRVDQRQQHGGVGIGADRDPVRGCRLRAIVADRADIDDLDAGAGELGHPAWRRMLAAAALGHLQVLGIGAAEQQQQAGVTRDRRP